MADFRTPLARAIFEGDVDLARSELEAGADPNAIYASYSYVGLATFHGVPEVLLALIKAGGRVDEKSLAPLREMDITDWMIDSAADEARYAEVARILIYLGASPAIRAYDGSKLIETFSQEYYPQIHHVLASATKQALEPYGNGNGG